MNTKTPEPSTYANREMKNSTWAVFSSIAWGASLALSAAVLINTPEPTLLMGIFALVINVGIGIAALMAHIRWLKDSDEMIRKIWIESMAMTFAVLWIAVGSLMVLAQSEVVAVDHVEIGLLFLLAAMGFATGGFRTLKY